MTQSPLAQVKTFRSGISNIHLVEADGGVVAVDAGSCAAGARKLARVLAGLGLTPASVRLLVITHVHYDHVKAAAAIAGLCNCPVAVHAAEAPRLSSGLMETPPGVNWWGRAAAALARSPLGRALVPVIMSHQPVEAGVVVNGPLRLEQYGLAGSLVPTPGHSPGSISLVLDSGQAFVGDVVFNPYPFGLGPVMPPFAHNVTRLINTWQRLLAGGVKLIYPGHGPAMSAEILSRAYLRHAPAAGRG